MAFMNQERKQKFAPKIKKILAKHGVKGSLSVRNHSALVLTIRSGRIDFCQNWYDNWVTNFKNDPSAYQPPRVPTYIDVNTYHLEHFTGEANACLTELLAAMSEGNWDRSDVQSDYWDVGWWTEIFVGKWNKPYVVEN